MALALPAPLCSVTEPSRWLVCQSRGWVFQIVRGFRSRFSSRPPSISIPLGSSNTTHPLARYQVTTLYFLFLIFLNFPTFLFEISRKSPAYPLHSALQLIFSQCCH
ncbi:hypothetical protein BO82DRAFT_47067 [Aspergillus uvarum CBS 121591]|uniref:Uncharacterized protein n=1 Tax=Aspergillus uvarum CBS 121591 TaxID=1448315 RepID=A0A319DW83_9EURO|nr:hypothetical protein BO82DRAFT_47067 [Aspergillus uvarum CBS 121591]PYH83182.1 hypothetical protein BO82DRAFT_47067 [Aspergillus uvarum CBS 121591]